MIDGLWSVTYAVDGKELKGTVIRVPEGYLLTDYYGFQVDASKVTSCIADELSCEPKKVFI